MTNTTFVRFGGIALILAGVLSLVGGMLHPVINGVAHSIETMTSPMAPVAGVLISAATISLLVGLPALQVWLGRALGVVGSIGVFVYFITNLLVTVPHLTIEGLVAPALARYPAAAHALMPDSGELWAGEAFQLLAALAGIGLIVSLSLIGVGLLRSRAVPKWIAVLMFVGTLVAFAPIPEAAVISGLQIELCRGVAVISLGFLMARGHRSVPAVTTTFERATVSA